MSSWLLAVRALYRLGGSATADQIELTGEVTEADSACNVFVEAIKLGLVKGPGRNGRRRQPYTLTQLGVDFCENRVVQIRVRPGGSALRRDVAQFASSRHTDQSMLTCIITSQDVIKGGMHGVLRKLRDAGIPVRLSGDELRLLPVWNAEGTKIIGRGRLDYVQENFSGITTFRYWPPVVPLPADVIDVEARVVPEPPTLLR